MVSPNQTCPRIKQPLANIVMCWAHSRSSARGPGWPAALEGLWKPWFDTKLQRFTLVLPTGHNSPTRERGDRRRLSPRLRVGLVLARFRLSCVQRVSKPL